jgi:hypothetical protein
MRHTGAEGGTKSLLARVRWAEGSPEKTVAEKPGGARRGSGQQLSAQGWKKRPIGKQGDRQWPSQQRQGGAPEGNFGTIWQ